MSCYSRLIGQWPHVVLPIVILVVIACSLVSILVYPYPDLSDPIKGFEARGTPIKGRELVMYNLRDLSKTEVTEEPPTVFPEEVVSHPAVAGMYDQFTALLTNFLTSQPGGRIPDWRSIPPEDGRTSRLPSEQTLRIIQQRENSSGCFPGHVEIQPKVVFASRSGASLLSVSGLRSMCSLEKRLLPDSGCQARQSIPYFMEQLYGKSCKHFDEDDIHAIVQLLGECVPFFYGNQLNSTCLFVGNCQTVPAKCLKNNAVYNIMYYLSDDLFFAKSRDGQAGYSDKLTYALFSTPSRNLTLQEYYSVYIEGQSLVEGDIYVKGVHSLIKFDLFDDYLLRDMIYFGLAMLLILIAMSVYLRSIIVTVATVLDVIFTLVLSYVIYRFLGLRHFPFMNVLTGLICIAIGADDVFIFFDTWQQVKVENPNGNIHEWMASTFRHAALSIFVTSLTTASAFFANVVSEITDIRCFGIFSGIAILCNFIFMVTWVPSIIVLTEKITVENFKNVNFYGCCHSCVKVLKKCNVIFERFLPVVVKRTYMFWLPLLFFLGCGGIFAVFVKPALKLPSSKEFQVFRHSDPLEVWDTELKHKFRYFKDSEESTGLSIGLPIMAVWGIKEKDNGSPLDPDDHGVLRFDETFNMSSPKAQIWMEKFCRSFLNSSIVSPSMEYIPCTLTVFNKMMALPCVHSGLSPCCDQTAPFTEAIFNECFPKLSQVLSSSVNLGRLPSHGQPLYNRKTGIIQGFMITGFSSQTWSPILEDMHTYHNELEDFMKKISKGAPDGIQNGWITSYLKFYDLQRALSSGTYVAIGVSVAVAFIVMLLTSLNLLITVFALFTIILTIAVTVGALVLLGWELNILESVTISLAVGLSIDFTIHYGVAYRLSPSEDRIEKVRESFQRVGSPVAMAAFTTFIAGAAMMPAKVLAYTQLGVFLMIVMATSWVYSTFFFQSLCRVLGPRNTVISTECNQCHKKQPEEDVKVHPDPWDPDGDAHVMKDTLRSDKTLLTHMEGNDQKGASNFTTSLSNDSSLANGQIVNSTLANGAISENKVPNSSHPTLLVET